MQKFYDRISAYEEVQSAIQLIRQGVPSAVWIEGSSGVGKTRFLEYIDSQEIDFEFFTFKEGEIFYRCERGPASSSFEYISATIFEIQRVDPGFFERFIQNYFDCIEHISFLDACCLILPQLKGFKAISGLIETKYQNIASKQGNISDRLVTHQLIDLFSDLILGFLVKDKTKHVTFCIDDAQWLDRASTHVMDSLIRKSRNEKNAPVISVFLDTCEQSELDTEDGQNYQNVYRTISALYPGLKTIYLENFDLPTTREVIQETNRGYLIEQIQLIYKITGGNPLELEQTLRFSDERIRTILQQQSKSDSVSNAENKFVLERVSDIYYQETIYAVVLSILAVLRRHISESLLYQCTADIYLKILNDVCSRSEFSAALEYLKANDCITRNSFASLNMEIALAHDSTSRTVLDYLSQNGDYILYGKSIAKTLLDVESDTFLKSETKKLLALMLLSEVDPQECFRCFQRLYKQGGDSLESEFFVTGAKAFCVDFLKQSKENVQYAARIILPKLVSAANLTMAQRLSHMVYSRLETSLLPEEQILFLIYYIKAQIDLSVVNDGAESAITLFEKLYQLEFDDKDLRLQALLLGMSAYEHVLAHDKILELFCEAQTVVQEHEGKISAASMAVFYRNEGLCYPHTKLKKEYFLSLHHALHVPDVALRHLIYGTSMDNLGLSYFYGGDIKKASRAFAFSKKHLARVGYNTARVTNNLGVCYYMLHDWQHAYDFFSLAASAQTEGIFMSLCIQTNLALALYAIGKHEKAKVILDDLISEYTLGQPRSHDPLVYCAAMINRGYIAFQEKDYFFAAENYQKSLIHTYRYQNKEQVQKREMMRDIAYQRGTGMYESKESIMDLEDRSEDFYRKPYSLIPFAFYVI